jgi:hypothetical protein
MQPACSTDYFAVIPAVGLARRLGPSQQSVAEPSFKPTNPVTPRLISDALFHHRMAGDFSLLALVVTTATMVVCVIANLSH